MPYVSDKQRAYMHIHHPQIAARWDKEQKMDPLKKTAARYGRPKKRKGKIVEKTVQTVPYGGFRDRATVAHHDESPSRLRKNWERDQARREKYRRYRRDVRESSQRAQGHKAAPA